MQHKSEAGALELGLASDAVRAAAERLLALAAAERRGPAGRADGAAGVELLVAARADGVVPALVVGLGGIWTEALDDVAIIPCRPSPARVERALRGLRGASRCSAAAAGSGRPRRGGGMPPAGDVLLDPASTCSSSTRRSPARQAASRSMPSPAAGHRARPAVYGSPPVNTFAGQLRPEALCCSQQPRLIVDPQPQVADRPFARHRRVDRRRAAVAVGSAHPLDAALEPGAAVPLAIDPLVLAAGDFEPNSTESPR